MKPNELKRTLLKVFIGFLIATACIAIISVLTGEFGEFQVKVLATTLTISAASICSMSAAAFIERRRQRILGSIGIGLSCVAALLVIGGVWSGTSDVNYWRTTMSFIFLAIAVAHGLLLCLPNLAPAYRWVFTLGPLLIGVLVFQGLFLLWEIIDSEFLVRSTIVNSILVVLITLIVPILMRIGGSKSSDTSESNEAVVTLFLKQQREDVFVDSDGMCYRVIPQSEWPKKDDDDIGVAMGQDKGFSSGEGRGSV